MQQEALDQEIKNILWGMVKCLMYNPGKEFQKCQDEFWACLGFKVPFTFPKCSKMYADADEEIAKFASYRAYLKAKEKSEAQKTKPPRDQCLSPPSR